MFQYIFTRIRQLRTLKGVSQQYMATQLGISQSAYSKLERNEIPLSLGRLNQIAEILQVNSSDFLSSNMQIDLEQEKNINQKAAETNSSNYETQIKQLTDEIHLLRSQLTHLGLLNAKTPLSILT